MVLGWGRGPGFFLGLIMVGVLLGGGSPRAQTTTRQQADLQERLPEAPAATLSGAAPVISPEAEPDVAPVPEETFSFRLAGVNITRATVYDEADFAPLYEEFVGTDVTLGNLREIADRIEALYRGDGYVATRALIPPQAISDGVPTIEIYEGQVVYYEINGDIGPVKKQIAKLLDNMITGKPAKWSELERWLLLARDLPGISLTGTLRSAGDTAPGGVVVVVDTARKPLDGFVNFQNLSPDPTGPATLSGGLAFNSATEAAERVGFVALVAVPKPKEQFAGFMSYQQSLGSKGLLFKAAATRTRSFPGAELKPSKLRNDSLLANVQLEYPVMRGRKFSLWSRGGFEYIDQESVQNDSARIYDDRARVLFAGLHGVWRPWGGGLTQFDVQVRQGLNGLGATSSDGNRSRIGAVPDFLLVRGTLEHLQPLGPLWAINLKAVGQFSDDSLISVEEMALGNLTIGRGFEAGSVTGDRGWGVAAEVRFSTPDFISDPLKKYFDRVELFGFLDRAVIYDKNINTGEWQKEDVTSTGFGVRVQAIRTLYADIYYAIPLEPGLSIFDSPPPTGLYFNLTKFF